jgi:hypothetical protein
MATAPAPARGVSIHSIPSLVLNQKNFLLWKTHNVPALHASGFLRLRRRAFADDRQRRKDEVVDLAE